MGVTVKEIRLLKTYDDLEQFASYKNRIQSRAKISRRPVFTLKLTFLLN